MTFSLPNENNKEQSLKIAAAFCLMDIFLTGGAALFSNSLTILSDFFKESADFLSVVAALITVRVGFPHYGRHRYSLIKHSGGNDGK